MTAGRPPARRTLSHERRLLWLAFGAGAPGALVALLMLWFGDHTPKVQWTLTLFIVALWLGFAFAVRRQAVIPLQMLSNLLSALREGDFSIRARGSRGDDALGEVTNEINALSGTLHEQRLGALEATAFLNRVLGEVDIAVFAFDGERRLRLVNRVGERLLGHPAERLVGSSSRDLGLEACLEGETPRVLDLAFPGGAGRWEVRRRAFREGGLPREMVILSDLSRALREEERQAWQRLIRVMGHELNNSLAPIRSIAGSLASLLSKQPRPPDWEQDARRGLDVIGARSESLSRFMEAYARLAKLPRPVTAPLDIGALVRRVAGLETRLGVAVQPGPEVMVQADGDQIEQLLINLVRNAADAAIETGGGARAGWRRVREGGLSRIEVWVEDDGPGLSSTANLFVPFFTTKPGGSGIGLVLARQIAEAHGGSLSLENRREGTGCLARLRLPAA